MGLGSLQHAKWGRNPRRQTANTLYFLALSLVYIVSTRPWASGFIDTVATVIRILLLCCWYWKGWRRRRVGTGAKRSLKWKTIMMLNVAEQSFIINESLSYNFYCTYWNLPNYPFFSFSSMFSAFSLLSYSLHSPHQMLKTFTFQSCTNALTNRDNSLLCLRIHECLGLNTKIRKIVKNSLKCTVLQASCRLFLLFLVLVYQTLHEILTSQQLNMMI